MMKFAKLSAQLNFPCELGQGEAPASCTGTDMPSMVPPHIQIWFGGSKRNRETHVRQISTNTNTTGCPHAIRSGEAQAAVRGYAGLCIVPFSDEIVGVSISLPGFEGEVNRAVVRTVEDVKIWGPCPEESARGVVARRGAGRNQPCGPLRNALVFG